MSFELSLAFLVLFIAVEKATAQTYFQKVFYTDSTEVATYIIRSGPDYVITGWVSDDDGTYDRNILFMTMDTCGNQLITTQIGDEREEYGMCIGEDQGGMFKIAGATTSYGAGLWDKYLATVDNAGSAVQGVARGDTHNDIAEYLTFNENDDVVIVGTTDSITNTGRDIYVTSFDNNGGNSGEWDLTFPEQSDPTHYVEFSLKQNETNRLMIKMLIEFRPGTGSSHHPGFRLSGKLGSDAAEILPCA